jgi:hypothetical protein
VISLLLQRQLISGNCSFRKYYCQRSESQFISNGGYSSSTAARHVTERIFQGMEGRDFSKFPKIGDLSQYRKWQVVTVLEVVVNTFNIIKIERIKK